MKNQSLRDYAKNKSVNLWEVAYFLKISEPTFSRKLRFELSKEENEKIKVIIDTIAKEKQKHV